MTRLSYGGLMRPVPRADLTTFRCRLSWNFGILGVSTSCSPNGPVPLTLVLLYNMLLVLSSLISLTTYALIPPNFRKNCSNFGRVVLNWRVVFIRRCLQLMSESEAVMQEVNRIVRFRVGVACTERLLQDKRYQKILGPTNYSARSVWCAVGQPVVDLYTCLVRTGCLYGHQRHINTDRKCVCYYMSCWL